jgi:hypothetical protein
LLCELGLVDVTTGAASTVKRLLPVAAVVSGLVTVTLRATVAAPEATVKVAVMEVEVTKLTEDTVTPVPEIPIVAPLSKPVPVIVTV